MQHEDHALGRDMRSRNQQCKRRSRPSSHVGGIGRRVVRKEQRSGTMARCTPPVHAASEAGRGTGGSPPQRAMRERPRWIEICAEEPREGFLHQVFRVAVAPEQPVGDVQENRWWFVQASVTLVVLHHRVRHIKKDGQGQECDMRPGCHIVPPTRPWFMTINSQGKTRWKPDLKRPQSAPRNLNLALAVIALAQLMVVSTRDRQRRAAVISALCIQSDRLNGSSTRTPSRSAGCFSSRRTEIVRRRRMFVIGALLFTAGSSPRAGQLVTS